jgi:hypothetical protein
MSHPQRKYKIFVNYFIQNDSWESINQPNLFVIPDEFQNLNDVKAQIIYDNFPLISHFNYYLRFYLNDKTQGVNGWIDYPPNATVPVYNNGHVYVKALRIPKNIQINFKNSDLFQKSSKKNQNQNNSNNKNLLNMSLNEKNDAKLNEIKNKNSGFVIPEGIDFGNIENNLKENKDNKNLNNNMNNMNNMNNNMNNNINSPIHKQNTIPKAMNNMPMNNNINNNMNLNNNNNNNPNIQRSNTNNSKTPILLNNNTQKFQELNLDNIFSSNTNSNNNTNNINLNNNNNNNNLNNNNLNNNIPFQPQQKRSQSPKLDSNLNSINFNIPIDTGNSSDNNTTNTNNSNQTFDFTSSNKSKYPIDNVPNTLPEDDIKERVDKIIREWTMGVNEKKSLLFLITTLHEVWTNDPKLETPQMQILVNDKTAVRTYYKKAMRILHSDKNKDKDFKTRYIAESLYQILNEANAAYN